MSTSVTQLRESSVKHSPFRPVLTLKHGPCYTGHLALVNTEHSPGKAKKMLLSMR